MDPTVRKTFLSKRDQVHNRDEKEKAIAQKLLPFLHPDQKIAAYLPIRNEVDIWSFLTSRIPASRLMAPKVLDGQTMIFLPASRLKPGVWGILEPEGSLKEAQVPDIVLIPLVGFWQTNRLGYGGGYYDRYLAAHPEIVKIGIAFDEQEGEFPIQPWDIPLDYLVTPTRIFQNESK